MKKFKIRTIEDIALQFIKHNEPKKAEETSLNDTLKDSKLIIKKYVNSKNSDSVLGANDRVQLAQLNEIARIRVLNKHMANGVNIPCTDGVIIGTDVKIAANTTILPSTVIKGKTTIGSFCTIGPAAYIENSVIADSQVIRIESVVDKC